MALATNGDWQPVICDWDDAYANRVYIPDGESYPPRWVSQAQLFRDQAALRGSCRLNIAYGPGSRQVLDVFLPEHPPLGLMVFVHGGYWLAFDKSVWSHLARGCVEAGWAVAMPSYTLAPEASVSVITGEVAGAITHAAAIFDGPIRLAGHSAGGHLVTRMMCTNAPLAAHVHRRIEHVVSISGVHDLRPLQRTAMAAKLFHHPAEAAAESPVLLEPIGGIRLTCWVGTEERPEFLRQNDLLANIWTGLGAETCSVHDPGHHHFSVIEGLTQADSALTRALLAAT